MSPLAGKLFYHCGYVQGLRKDSLWEYAMPEAEKIGGKVGQSPSEFEADMQDGDGIWLAMWDGDGAWPEMPEDGGAWSRTEHAGIRRNGGKMKYKMLQSTDLKVSGICLGTVKYGTDMAERDAWEQMDSFLDLGGNFLDTAHVYGDWTPGERAKSEHVIGRFLKNRGNRSRVIISTKGAHPYMETMGESRVKPECIRRDLEESLQALGTDEIDLYFLHRDDLSMPVEEILGVLEDERRKGKIRWYGCSNWTLPRLQEADRIAKAEGYSGFVCNQLMWSLAKINASGVADPTLVLMDQDTYRYHAESGKSAMAYTAAAQGYLAKRMTGAYIGDSLRAQYDNRENEEIIGLLREYRVSPGEFALAWMMHHDFVSIPIVTFRTALQLWEGIRSTELEMPEELVWGIREIKRKSREENAGML